MYLTQPIILAGGKGTRMNQGKASGVPKVLFKIGNKPMISYILETFKKLQVIKPIIVVGYKYKSVIDELGSEYLYALQTKRLGTGHAVKIGLKKAYSSAKDIFIVNGDDSAFYSQNMLKGVFKAHEQNNAVITMLIVKIPGASDYGRIVRNTNNDVIGIVEKSDLTDDQAKIDLVNCGAYLINTAWLKTNIGKIKKSYKGGKEYPITDLIKLAVLQNQKISGFVIDRKEWVGVNNLEQLSEANRLITDNK
jgi:bifunctional UDP-N-acetylglucosamine pyrophosphorylase/glucosamine-1-phosphate N-acetyltransferase